MMYIAFFIFEDFMGKIVNPNTAGKDRTRLLKTIALAIRELEDLNISAVESRDLIAFVSLALDAVVKTIEKTVTPWEKRGYWVKADKFRMEWAWIEKCNQKLKISILEEDMSGVENSIQTIKDKISDTKVPKRKQVETLWDGAWEKFISKKLGKPLP